MQIKRIKLDTKKQVNIQALHEEFETHIVYYHLSAYTEPWTDWGMWNSFSNWDGPQISSWTGESFSGFFTTSSLEPEGEGTIREAFAISTGNWAHWKVTELLLPREIWADRINFLLLFARRFGWLIENIACEPFPVIVFLIWVQIGWERREIKGELSSHTLFRLKYPCLVNVADVSELLK